MKLRIPRRGLRAFVVVGLGTPLVGALGTPRISVEHSANPEQSWTQVGPETPLPEYASGVAFDGASKHLIMFGGRSPVAGNLNATWTWNDSRWIALNPSTTPPPLSYVAMTYDPATSDIVMFGGDANQTDSNQTWVWTGSNWVNESPAISPPRVEGASMAFDAATNNIVLYGAGDGENPGATWTWDGANWTEENTTPNPGPRIWASMSYDVATREGSAVWRPRCSEPDHGRHMGVERE